MVIRARLLALLFAALAAACSPNAARGPRSNTLVMTGLAGEPDSLNPLVSGFADLYDFSHLYLSYLVESDARGELIPEIAQSVPSQRNGGISPDGRTIVYRLRPRVRWQDGAPLTARDVVFSYRAEMNPANDVAVRTGYTEVDRIGAPDDRTVVVHLRRPYAPFISEFFGPQSVGAILPAHLLARFANLNRVAYNERPVGSGPFRVVRWRHGDSVTLEANPLYWRGKPKIARIVYRVIPDPNTRLEQLRTGEADAYFDVDPQLLPQVQSLPGVRVLLTPIADMHILRFNLRDPDLADIRVRRAIAEAIDRTRLAAAATHGSGIVVNADQPVGSWAYDAAVPAVRYDPADARRLLRRARGDSPLQLTLAIAPAGINGSNLVATQIQSDLQAVGIGVTIKTYPPSAFWGPAAAGGALAAGHFQLAYDAWWVLGPDPDDAWNLACSQQPPRGINYDRWCDPQANRAISDAQGTFDRSRRIADYAVVQRRLAATLPELTLWQVRMPAAVRTRVRGVAPSRAGSTFWNAWAWQLKSR